MNDGGFKQPPRSWGCQDSRGHFWGLASWAAPLQAASPQSLRFPCKLRIPIHRADCEVSCSRRCSTSSSASSSSDASVEHCFFSVSCMCTLLSSFCCSAELDPPAVASCSVFSRMRLCISSSRLRTCARSSSAVESAWVSCTSARRFSATIASHWRCSSSTRASFSADAARALARSSCTCSTWSCAISSSDARVEHWRLSIA
mmetsp:Transcript_25611/g.66199  ORF Transcript_25611/g.66199 Transcript_25611/m.66199 type:complete len:202 (+) Transcript_25611:117-722(+)